MHRPIAKSSKEQPLNGGGWPKKLPSVSLRSMPDKEVAKDERPHLRDQSLFVRGKPASGRESWS